MYRKYNVIMCQWLSSCSMLPFRPSLRRTTSLSTKWWVTQTDTNTSIRSKMYVFTQNHFWKLTNVMFIWSESLDGCCMNSHTIWNDRRLKIPVYHSQGNSDTYYLGEVGGHIHFQTHKRCHVRTSISVVFSADHQVMCWLEEVGVETVNVLFITDII